MGPAHAGRERRDITCLWTDTYSAQTLAFYTRSPLGNRLWRGQIATFRRLLPDVPDAVGAGPLLVTRYGALSGPSEATGWRLLWRSSDNTTLSVWIHDSARAPRRDAAEQVTRPSSFVIHPNSARSEKVLVLSSFGPPASPAKTSWATARKAGMPGWRSPGR